MMQMLEMVRAPVLASMVGSNKGVAIQEGIKGSIHIAPKKSRSPNHQQSLFFLGLRGSFYRWPIKAILGPKNLEKRAPVKNGP